MNYWYLAAITLNFALNLFLLRCVGELHARISEVDSWHTTMGKKMSQQQTKFMEECAALYRKSYAAAMDLVKAFSRGKPAETQDATLGHGPEQK